MKVAPVYAELERRRQRRAAARAHGPALRPRDQRRLLRGAAASEAAPPARDRLRHARRADRQGADRARAALHGAAARPRGRPRRRQLARSPAALAAAKLNIPVCHLESGLRSFDSTMPEEHNRRLTDHLSALLLTHSEDANENLLDEGVDPTKLALRREHDDRHAARERRKRARRSPPGATSASRTAATCSSRCTGPRSSTTRG